MTNQMKTINRVQNPLLERKNSSSLRLSDFLIMSFWAIYLFVRLWVADSENLNESYQAAMVVPYFNGNIGTIMLVLTVIVFGGLLIVNHLKVDSNFLLFLLRIGLYFIPILYIEGEFRFGVAYAIIQTMLAYYIGYNYKGKLKTIINILIVATLILLGQIFYTLLYNELSIFGSNKWFMRLPGGQTNSLGAFLVISYVIVDLFYADSKKAIKYLYFVLMWLGVWCTGTRSGILLLIGYYCLKWGKNIFLDKSNKGITTKKLLLGVSILFIFGILLIVFKDELWERVQLFTIEGMTSSRLKVYSETFEYILQCPLLGRSAFSYKVFDAVKTHNFLLESLIQTGVLGTIIYLWIWGYCFSCISKIQGKKIRTLFQFFILITLIHGFVEPNLFSVTSDTFVWFLLGVGVSISKKNRG